MAKILKSDESYLQECLVCAINGERLKGQEAARLMVCWIKQGKFTKDGKAKSQKWFLEKIREYPYEAAKKDPTFLFGQGEIVEASTFIFKFKVKVLERFETGKTVSKKEIPFIANPIKLEKNAYLVQAIDDPTQLEIFFEDALSKIGVKTLKKK